MVIVVKGDLFKATEDILAHGCNCKGGFGSGVAGQMAKRYPTSRNHYMDKHLNGGWELGDVQFVPQGKKWIANCATQKNYVPRDMCHADYDAIKSCMEKVKEFAKERNLSVALPKIGAGLAGGDWKVIKKILKEVFVDYDCTVYYLD